ncbi:MAG: cupin domain-containing protein [Candidatus Eiseniibacteriota bacterium]
MAEPSLTRWDAARDGRPTEAAMRARLETLGYEVHRYVYSPGTVFPEHAHDVDKIDAVLAGRFRMSAPGVDVVLVPGDMLVVPRGTVHRAEVVGEESVVSLDATRSER